jgi:DNA-binding HxlR family transcriptional regulator
MNAAECPLSIALKPLKGKWEPVIIKYISMNGESGYNGIYKGIEKITPKALTEALRTLSDEGIITRKTISEKPHRVIYGLTKKGKAMIIPLDAIESLNGNVKAGTGKTK